MTFHIQNILMKNIEYFTGSANNFKPVALINH